MTMADEASFLGEAPLTELIRDWIKGFAPRVAPHLQNPITDSFIKVNPEFSFPSLTSSRHTHELSRPPFRLIPLPCNGPCLEQRCAMALDFSIKNHAMNR